MLGAGWAGKLELLSYEGTINAERIVPVVIIHNIPGGVRGLMLVALMAASLSTFNVTVNKAAAMWTNDLYRAFMRPQSRDARAVGQHVRVLCPAHRPVVCRRLRRADINSIWGWITMGLASGMGMPLLLRFYWWRFNGAGFAAGMFGGLIAALLVMAYNTYYPEQALSEVTQFLLLTPISLVLAIIGTYLGRPTPTPVVEHFYQTDAAVRVLGVTIRSRLAPEVRAATRREHRNDLIALPIAFVWMVTMYLAPMQLMIGRYAAGGISAALFALSCAGLYVFWYRNLPSPTPRTVSEPASAAPPVTETKKVNTMRLQRYEGNPILKPNPDHPWESMVTTNPGAWYDRERREVLLLYRAAGFDEQHVIRLGLARSSDGRHFEREPEPVFGPSRDGFDAGCVEDPRITKMGDYFYITYASRPFPRGSIG